jgi:Holliday junction resolvasome RuvABC endonuclease subunit
MRSLLIWVVLFAAGLLVGFIPQYMKARHYEWQATFCNSSLQLAQVRRAAALTYVSASQLNYGTATNYAKQLFDQAQQAVGSASDPNVRSMLNDVLSSRDKIMTDLAKGNSQALTDLQPIVLKVEGASQ